VRYELIEFALVTLASRAQELIPLHAACVGQGGAGTLLMGASGTGKSTLCLQSLSSGIQILSEDSAFVHASSMLVTGTSNYLHIQKGALEFLEQDSLKRKLLQFPLIRRRSGLSKIEIDLRTLKGSTVRAPLRVAAAVFLSRRASTPKSALRPLGQQELLGRLRREQPYAMNLPNWRTFERRLASIPAFELRRTKRVDSGILELQELLKRTTS
jgi:hypothetical protein